MSATATAIPRPVAGRTPGHLAWIFLNEAKFEFLKLIRLPIYALSTIMFPVMFYVLFGLLLNRGQELSRVTVAAYLLASCRTPCEIVVSPV